MAMVVVGLVLLYFGAESLVKGASALALALGLTPLVIGLTVVAYGTSLPELAVSVTAALEGSGGMAVGNVVGSNICNIGIVLGVAALCRPLVVTRETTGIYVPFMLASAVLTTVFLVDDHLAREEGLVLLIAITGYTIFGMRRARRQVADQKAAEDNPEPAPRPGFEPVGYVLFGLALLLFGGRVLVNGSVSLAQYLGVSEAVIALTVVAFGTSAPDLAASAVAAWRGHGELAAGNAIGSVIFNLLNVLGVAALVRPFSVVDISRTDHLVQFAFLVLTLPLLGRGLVMRRWEGAICVIGYLAYVVWRWPK